MSLEGFLKTGNLVDFLETESSDTELSDLKIKAESMRTEINDIIKDLKERIELANKFDYKNNVALGTLEKNMLDRINLIVTGHYREFSNKVEAIKGLYETKVEEAVATTANKQTLLLQEQTEIWKKIVKNFRGKITEYDDLFTQREEFRKQNFYEWQKQVTELLEEYRAYIGGFEDYLKLEAAHIEKRETKFNEEMENYKIQCANQISQIAKSYDLAEKKRSTDTKAALDQAIENQGRSFLVEKEKWLNEASGKVTELTTEVEKGKTETNKAKSAATKLNQVYTEKTQEYEQLKNDTQSLITKLNETNLKILKSLGDKRSVIV